MSEDRNPGPDINMEMPGCLEDDSTPVTSPMIGVEPEDDDSDRADDDWEHIEEKDCCPDPTREEIAEAHVRVLRLELRREEERYEVLAISKELLKRSFREAMESERAVSGRTLQHVHSSHETALAAVNRAHAGVLNEVGGLHSAEFTALNERHRVELEALERKHRLEMQANRALALHTESSLGAELAKLRAERDQAKRRGSPSHSADKNE